MDSIPPRINKVEQELHTMQYRLDALENHTSGIPERMARVESAVQDIPEIRRKLSEINDIIQKSFAKLYGISVGLGVCWALITYGPKILKILGSV